MEHDKQSRYGRERALLRLGFVSPASFSRIPASTSVCRLGQAGFSYGCGADGAAPQDAVAEYGDGFEAAVKKSMAPFPTFAKSCRLSASGCHIGFRIEADIFEIFESVFVRETLMWTGQV